MKNLFGLDVTDDKNTRHDGLAFITKRISPDIEIRLDSAYEQDNSFEKNATFPIWLVVVKYILIILTVSVTLGILQSDVSFAEGYRNAPYFYWITPPLWIVSICIIIFERSKAKKVYSSKEFSEHMENVVKAVREAAEYLEIPGNAADIDVLFVMYTRKNGKLKRKNFPFSSHMNCNYKAYVRNENLCLSDLRCIMEIPLQSLKSVHIQKKKASFPNWNKDEPFNSTTYKPFKITFNNQGTYFAEYYSVEIQDIKGDFEFFVPNYDIVKLCQLTGLNINEK